MKTIANHFLLVLVLFNLLQCSDFHPAIISNGKLAVQDTVNDTLVIPGDSVFLDTLFPNLDTVFSGVAPAWAGRYMELSFNTLNAQGIDSLHLAASFLANDTLDLRLRTGNSGYQRLNGVQLVVQGNRLRHNLRQLLGIQREYTLRWRVPRSGPDIGILVALGYRSDSAFFHPVVEFQSFKSLISLNPARARQLEPGWAWDTLSLYSGDSITGFVDGSAGLEAYLTDAAGFQNFLLQLNVNSADALFSNQRDGDTLQMQITNSGVWYWILHNPTTATIPLQDSLLAWQLIQP